MTAYDSEKFRAEYKRLFGEPTPGARAGLDLLLGYLVADAGMADDRYKAYALASVYHETAKTFQPIDERGSDLYFIRLYYQNPKVRKWLGNTSAEDAVRYHGRGLIQVTGRALYAKFSPIVGVDLLAEPEKAKEWDISYRILAEGCLKGLFTGKKFSDYLRKNVTDFFNCRRVVNSLDRAEPIAQYALRFQTCLLKAKE